MSLRLTTLIRLFIPLAATLATQQALAAQIQNEAERPSQNTPSTDSEAIEPQITIIRRGAETIEEYRHNNQLYMIKVTPAKGYAYYLVDTDGDGNLDTRRSDLDPAILTPQWPLIRWK